jgi:[acyl-carrier-protein] S-malonyltransferase
LSFEDGLNLVSKRAIAMQKACEKNPSTMAAVLGIEDNVVEKICGDIKEIVVPANYNCPGQLVISGSNKGIDIACEKLTEVGARRALKLPVGGAFHSPLMEPARTELEKAIDKTNFSSGICPIYQNVTATAITNPQVIKENLKKQLTSSVMWTQTIQQMIKDGLSSVTEVGPGNVLQGLFKKVDRNLETQSATL